MSGQVTTFTVTPAASKLSAYLAATALPGYMLTVEVEKVMLPNDHAWRCDCGGGHFLTFWWGAGDPDATFEGSFGIEGDSSTTLRDRIVQAWRHIRGACSTTRVGVYVDKETATEIRDALNEFLATDA